MGVQLFLIVTPCLHVIALFQIGPGNLLPLAGGLVLAHAMLPDGNDRLSRHILRDSLSSSQHVVYRWASNLIEVVLF